MKDTNTAAIEELRGFAIGNNEIAFAHLCTAALNGEAWALERVTAVLDRIAGEMLLAIRAADTTRPDGSVARDMTAPV